ncbi:hypothetical protein ASG01_15190 [Chryseobacterium sp. Leaf180]|jgi:microcystin-dependent protein|uniref:phage tail protein n=1 Tax=Chryseobacterium sp. Leaf180 TaxID=1736289 RepID=UPI0006FC689D|nr:tail fiber protein [Chryseobacterium sp. Leaf180]KQR90457.1 hypothetical protein ASG01_15190 [Chryseobacterium sp. Leaf180]
MDGNMSEIRMFAGDFAPKNWAFCLGQTLQINTNQALFSLLGTTYGGDGITTFKLPNFAGRTPMGSGNAQGYPLGEMTGTENITCTVDNLPAHSHTSVNEKVALKTYSEGGGSASPTGGTLAAMPGLYSSKTPDAAMKPVQGSYSLTSAGSSMPVSIRQPYLGMNYIICTLGLFPSRT